MEEDLQSLLAAFLDPQKFNVSIYEKNKTLGRKFLWPADLTLPILNPLHN
jgi:hypothetical protein